MGCGSSASAAIEPVAESYEAAPKAIVAAPITVPAVTRATGDDADTISTETSLRPTTTSGRQETAVTQVVENGDARGEETPAGPANSVVVVSDLDRFIREVLEATNRFRAKHGAPPLVLDDTLSAYSQNWAQHLAKTGKFEHSTNSPYGENLWWAGSTSTETTYSGEEAVKSWYDEIQDYDYKNPGFSMGTGHFTQLVWTASQRLGVGYVEGRGKKMAKEFHVVCNYDPPGNYLGRFPEHVLKPL